SRNHCASHMGYTSYRPCMPLECVEALACFNIPHAYGFIITYERRGGHNKQYITCIIFMPLESVGVEAFAGLDIPHTKDTFTSLHNSVSIIKCYFCYRFRMSLK